MKSQRRPALFVIAVIASAFVATVAAAPARAQVGLHTNGSSQYVTFGAAPSLDSPTFTLEVWFKREGAGLGTSTGNGGIASAIPLIAKGRAEVDGDTRDMNYFLGIRASDGVLVADYEEGSGQTSPGLNHPIAGVTATQLGVWYHAAATFDGRNWRLYLNGNVEKDTLMSTGRLPQSSSIQHGSLASALNSSGTPDGYFLGTIDEPRIWSYAKTGQAIRDSMTLEIASAPGLIGRWALDTISGTTTPTSVPGGVAGTVVGGATTAPGAPFSPPPPPPPPAPSSLSLNGSSQYVTFGAAPSLDSPTFTLELWFERQGAGVGASTGNGGIASAIPLIAKGRAEVDGDTRDMNYFLGIRASDGVLVADYEEGSGQTSPGLNHPIAGVTATQLGVWYHAAATFDGRNWRLYLNGNVEKDTLMSTGRLPQSSSIQHGSLGSALNSTGVADGYFQGLIDEARVWDHARAGQAIHDSLGLEIPTAPGLIGRWALDAVNSNVTPTTVPGGVAGTVVGGAVTGPSAPFTVPPPPPPSSPPNAPVLVSPSDQATGVSTSPDLSVSVSDPDGGNLDVTFYGRPVGGGSQAGPDFTLIGLPDTQFYVSSLNGGSPAIFDSQTNWILANRDTRNIADVIQLGDCVQNGDNGGNPVEWQYADHSFKIIENPSTTQRLYGIPFGVCVGNHDQSPNDNPDGTTTFYNQYFGTARFSGRPYYGGHYGSNNDNFYQLFSASGLDFIVVSMEFDPTPDAAVLAWADQLLTTYANRRAIIASHYIMEPGFGGAFGTQGQAIYNALKGHANLFMMLCGHRSPSEGRRTDTYNGHTVYTFMSDYQDRTHGGDGWLRIYEFSPANNVIRTRTYSPWLGQFETDADSSSQFTLPYDMSGGAAPSPFQVIATRTGVASGSRATATWPGLASNTSYEWYATVSDGSHTVTGPTWKFTTGGSSSYPSANLVPNGGFETDTKGWVQFGSGTLSRAGEGHTGTHSLKIKGSGSASTVFGCDDSPNVVATAGPPGSVYRFSAWVKTPTSSHGASRLQVFEYVGSTQQGTTTYSPSVSLSSSWQQISVDYTVRSAGSNLSLRVADTPVAGGETFEVDDISIIQLSAPAAALTAGAVAQTADEPQVGPESEPPAVLSARFSPNPAPGEGTLAFVLTRVGAVRLELFDATGRRVRTLLDGAALSAGPHAVTLEARGAGGEALRPGLYFYRLETEEGALHGRIVMLR